jgi:ferritin
MDKKLSQELNKQIQEEMFSAYLYLSMSAFATSKNFDGFANWFMVQAKEEMDHALGFYTHLLDRGEKVELLEIAKPDSDFKGLEQLFPEALKHEQHITSRIHLLYDLASEVKDHAASTFLHWYITEQVEEENNATKYMEKVEMAKGMIQALLILDNELATRTYTPLVPGQA